MPHRLLLTLSLAAGIVAAAAPAASGSSHGEYENPAPIVILPDGNAATYPSTLFVSGLNGPIADVNVVLRGFSHTRPDDVGIVLKSPADIIYELSDGAGDDTDAADITWSFDFQTAPSHLPDTGPLSSGTFKPTSYYVGSDFPAPGPGTNYIHPGPGPGPGVIGDGGSLAAFNGTDGNGTWSLFIRDFVAGEGGLLADGWSLELLPLYGFGPPTPAAGAPATPSQAGGSKKCKRGGKSAAAAKKKRKKCRKKGK